MNKSALTKAYAANYGAKDGDRGESGPTLSPKVDRYFRKSRKKKGPVKAKLAKYGAGDRGKRFQGVPTNPGFYRYYEDHMAGDSKKRQVA